MLRSCEIEELLSRAETLVEEAQGGGTKKFEGFELASKAERRIKNLLNPKGGGGDLLWKLTTVCHVMADWSGPYA